ncbi:hypothetical protein NM208_g15282 [Fusarium decemcellulare]|uniref:Uncharacterized protein n=1 Tax=Fusarium decemcellulare TaxID=57161 RepID=A0ACC1RDK7_9HYPO|nr:hypothetical protein NM208_g15282 [Fusarium decemcellulare]
MSSQHEYGLVPLSSENLLPEQGPYDRRESQGGMPFDYDTAYTGQSSQSSFHNESHASVPTSADRKYVNSYSAPVTHQGYRDLPYNTPPGRGAKEHADAVRNSQLSRRTSMIWDLVVDLLLVIPALAFLLYAAAATHYDGRPLTEKGWHAVATLYDISVYTPTIFPIVFAAIAANLLKSVAAWKLERGISVLSLEYLLRSRTVFSAVTSPVILKSANALTPLVITFWALSPLGGQAALRVLNTTPNGHKQPWNCSYLELRPEVPPIFGVEDYAVNSTVIATFAAALASPADSKEAKQDIFTNVKIPMIEPYLFSSEGDQGWYKLRDDKDPFYAYSSLVGLPLKPQEPFVPAFNYSVRLNTSYISANCTANNRTMDIDGWWDYVDQHRDFSNGKGLIIETSNHTNSSAKPRLIQVTSYQPGELTNVFCEVSTSFVEVEIECHHSQNQGQTTPSCSNS